MKLKLVLFLLLLASKMWSCDCAQLAPLTKEKVKSYEFVFEGTVDSVTSCRDGFSLAWFTVKDVFHGNVYKSFAVQFDCASSCQMNFSRGQTWLIYGDASERYDRGLVGLCSYSRKKAEAGEDDFYLAISGGRTYDAELQFLVSNFGKHEPKMQNTNPDQLPKNMIPQGYTPLWWLIASFAGLAVLYLITRRFLKF